MAHGSQCYLEDQSVIFEERKMFPCPIAVLFLAKEESLFNTGQALSLACLHGTHPRMLKFTISSLNLSKRSNLTLPVTSNKEKSMLHYSGLLTNIHDLGHMRCPRGEKSSDYHVASNPLRP